MKHIVYKAGYKYQLQEDYTVKIEIKPDATILTEYITLSTDGTLRVKESYAWDGPSGPTLDTSNFMRGSLVHDALYQLMRDGYLDRNEWRKPIDILLRKVLLEDGMSYVRAWCAYWGIRLFAAKYARVSGENPTLWAP